MPLRAVVVEQGGHLGLKVPRYAAEVFSDHGFVKARVGTAALIGAIEGTDDRWLFLPRTAGLRESGLGHGDPIDVSLRAEI